MVASITISVGWDMGHRLPRHTGACRHLHGHHYTAEVTVAGEISTVPNASDEGMVMDFSLVKERLRHIVAGLDHKFLISAHDPLADRIVILPGVVEVPYVPTAENIALFLLNALPEATTVKLWETPTSYAEVRR